MIKAFFLTLKNNSFFELFFFSCLACFILTLRVLFSDSYRYIFLVWNLFLAWIPYGFSILIIYFRKKNSTSFLLLILGVLWLLFFPNAPYIITDFVHLKESTVPLWYDIALLSAFAWNGFFLAFISLNQIHKVLNDLFSKFISWFFVSVILLISSFGIYVGRYLRWNSWDVFKDPIPLGLDIVHRILFPFSHPRTYGVMMVYSLLLFGSYLTFCSIINKNKD